MSRQVVVQKSDADSDGKGKTLAQKGFRQKPGAYNDIKFQKLVQRCGRKKLMLTIKESAKHWFGKLAAKMPMLAMTRAWSDTVP